jgi:hypothetical protein
MEGKPKRSSDFRLEEIDGELLLFHPGTAKMIYCNQTASVIWQLCDGERTMEEIVELLTNAYPEAADGMAEDVEATIQQFVAQNAIELV